MTHQFFNTSTETETSSERIIVTAGSTYLDIDAYACCVAMKELLLLRGYNAIAYSAAPYNYSVCKSLVEEGQFLTYLPAGYKETSKYIIVDVSDPAYIKDAVPLDKVSAVYDHHAGFEEYWHQRIGDDANIEFIGAAATLVYREWKKYGLQNKMTRSTALLLIAAILDNTLNLTSPITTSSDREAFNALCRKENIDENWCASYFSEVQSAVNADLKNALFNDIKINHSIDTLPAHIAQICLWDAESIFANLPIIREWFSESYAHFMINIIDIKHQCSYFVCDETKFQKTIERLFDVSFQSGVARSSVSYLRKEIIRKVILNQ